MDDDMVQSDAGAFLDDESDLFGWISTRSATSWTARRHQCSAKLTCPTQTVFNFQPNSSNSDVDQLDDKNLRHIGEESSTSTPPRRLKCTSTSSSARALELQPGASGRMCANQNLPTLGRVKKGTQSSTRRQSTFSNRPLSQLTLHHQIKGQRLPASSSPSPSTERRGWTSC